MNARIFVPALSLRAQTYFSPFKRSTHSSELNEQKILSADVQSTHDQSNNFRINVTLQRYDGIVMMNYLILI